MAILTRRTVCALSLSLLAAAFPAHADTYPSKPVRILLPFPPGGSVDIIARMIGPALSERLGQPVVIENKPGAGGNLAMDAVAKAAPDGYTIGIGATGALGLNAITGQPMSYSPLKDLAPIGRLATGPFVLVAHPSANVSNVAELIAAAKRNPNQFSIGHGGNGTQMRLSTELFKHMAGVSAVSVPYKGTGPATADAVAGQIQLAMSDPASAIPFIQSGRVKALGVTSLTRTDTLPNVPTFAEQGLTGYESIGWFALVGPAATPPAIIQRLNTELNAVLRDPATKARITANGFDAAPTTPAELQELMRTDVAKWTSIVKTIGLTFE